MAKIKKIWLCDLRCESLDPDVLEGEVPEIIEKLEALQASWAEDSWRNLRVELDWGNDYVQFQLFGDRLETEDEARIRIAQVKRQKELRLKEKATQEAEERKLYTQLKKKYGKKENS